PDPHGATAMTRRLFWLAVASAALWPPAAARAELKAGTAVVDVTPERFPVVVNGMFTERLANAAHDRVYARCLVLDDGATRVALCVVDSCMMPRELLDEAKAVAPT